MVAEQRKFVEGIGQIHSAWEVKSANEVSLKITKGTTPPKSDIVDHQEIPFLRVNNLGFNGLIDKKSDFIFVSRSAHEGFLARSRAYPGDILMNIVGPPLGKVSLLGDEFSEYNMNQAIVIYRLRDDVIHREFFLAYLLSDAAQQWLQSRSKKTSGQQNLTIELCKGLPVPIPALDEQKKIAQILSTWDKAITTTEQLLANSLQQKKALMQQLLTGKKRLGMLANSYDFKKTRYGIIPKDWEYPAIKDVCIQVTEKNTNATDYPVLSCSKYDGFVDSLKYFKKKVYSDDTSGYRLIHRGCFGFPSNHVEEGSIGLQNLYDTGIVSPIYVVFRAKSKKVDNTYLYAVLKTDHYRQIFGAATNASVDRRGSLRWKEFSLIHVPLPPLEEQQRISTVLATADQEISALQQKFEALKQEKKALMQQLLTGKRRVKIDNKEVA